jgi:hypothetical protein
MNKYKLLLSFCFIFIIYLNLYAQDEINPNAGTTAASWLKIGVGGRASAMGEAYTSMCNDASAIFWNPANLSTVDSTQILTQYGQWFSGMTYNALGLAIPILDEFRLPIGCIGVGVTFLDGGQIRSTRDLSDAEKSDSQLTAADWIIANNMCAMAAGSFALSDSIAVGLTGKYISETIGSGSATAIAGDAGLLLTFGLENEFNIGVVAQNIGQTLSGYSLPQIMRAGISMKFGGMTLAGDFSTASDHASKLNAGLEMKLSELIALRFGAMTGTDDLGGSTSGLSAGAGLNFGALVLDAAIVPFGALGDTMRASLTLKF